VSKVVDIVGVGLGGLLMGWGGAARRGCGCCSRVVVENMFNWNENAGDCFYAQS
jgi:hypothetical protein